MWQANFYGDACDLNLTNVEMEAQKSEAACLSHGW